MEKGGGTRKWVGSGEVRGTAKLLTYWEAGFYDDGLRNLPETIVFIPAGLSSDLLQVAIVTVPANQGLHLLQELLEEQKVTFLPTDGGQVIDLLQLKLRLQIFDLHLCCSELKTKDEPAMSRKASQQERHALSCMPAPCPAPCPPVTHPPLILTDPLTHPV